MSDLDEQFPPRPGGMVDSARKAAAAAAALPETVGNTDGPVAYAAVRVRPEPPNLGTARTITLTANNPVLTLLGRDQQRRGAVILAIDNDVYISTDKDLANAAAGGESATGVAYLPAGIGIPISSQAQYWVAATTTATPSRVSVFIDKDSAP